MTLTFRVLPRHAIMLAGLLLAACSSSEPEYVERPVAELYGEAMNQLNEENYADAATAFNEVERQHPYSLWAAKAQLMAAYARYEDNKYDEAIVALDRFIQLHPGHEDVAYAYYLKALSYYEQISDVGRDQKNTDLALKALEEVTTRFPQSDYARDARLKIDLARNHLAGKEMAVGRFYQKQRYFLAAINRYRAVVDKYQSTLHTPEALYRLVESYLALGLTPEAERVASVLGFNYPGSDWYADAYTLVTGEEVQVGERAEKKSGGWFSWLF